MPVAIKWFPPSWFQINTKNLIIYIDPAYLGSYYTHYPKKIEFSRWPDPIDGLPEKLEKAEHGRRNWDKVFFNRVGYLAQQEVGRAYHKGEISFSEVIGVFNIKSKYAEKLVT